MLKYVGELKHLDGLTLARPKFTQAGLAHLKGLTTLTTVVLDNASDVQEEMVKRALPTCHVNRWEFPVLDWGVEVVPQ